MMRSRALAILKTAAGVVTVISGAVTFGASKSEEEVGIPDRAIWLLGIGLSMFVVAAFVAVALNWPLIVQKPDIDGLRDKVTLDGWSDGEDSFERERIVARTLLTYLSSLRSAVEKIAARMRLSGLLMSGGVLAVAVSAVWTAAAI